MPSEKLSTSILARKQRDGIALVPYITAGFPTRESMLPTLRAIAPHAAAIEIGVPFTDPMADGMTIQRSSRVALEQGVTLGWILDQLAADRSSSHPIGCPLVLMSYLNPLLALGLDGLAARCAASGVAALIIPDLPFEECVPIREALHAAGVGLVQMVTPVTPADRAAELARATDGFLYAVTMTGVTGAAAPAASPGAAAVGDYLLSLRGLGPAPVCAGFGIRSRHNVQALSALCDGAIVGSALVEVLERKEDPAAFLTSLR